MSKPLKLVLTVIALLLIVIIVFAWHILNRHPLPVLRSGDPNRQVNIGIITNGEDISENSASRLAWDGLKRAQEKYAINPSYIIPEAMTDEAYFEAIEQMQNNDVIISLAPELLDTVLRGCTAYHDKNFIMIGTESPDRSRYHNLTGVVIDPADSYFLAGYASANMSQTKNLAFLAVGDTDENRRLLYSFMAGVHTFDQEVKVHYDFSENEQKAIQVCEYFFKDESDILIYTGKIVNPGIADLAAKYSKQIITQNFKDLKENRGTVLISIEKKIDSAVYDGVRQYLSRNDLTGKNIYALGTQMEILRGGNAELDRKLLELKQSIDSGEIEIPDNSSSYRSYLKSLK